MKITSIAEKIKNIFLHENTVLNKTFKNRKPDIWFKNHHKTIIEVDEGIHKNYDSDDQKEKEDMFKDHSLKIFWFNPNDFNFDLFKSADKINLYISTWSKKKAANKVINKITEDFEKIVVVAKSKELKRYAKNLYQITKNEKHKIRNKTDKNWKKTWNNVLFWVQRFHP